MALWVLVLLADTAAAGSVTMIVYGLAAVVALAIVIVEMSSMAARRDQLKPQPVRVRAREHPRGGRHPGRR
jgi:hypothetical protein